MSFPQFTSCSWNTYIAIYKLPVLFLILPTVEPTDSFYQLKVSRTRLTSILWILLLCHPVMSSWKKQQIVSLRRKSMFFNSQIYRLSLLLPLRTLLAPRNFFFFNWIIKIQVKISSLSLNNTCMKPVETHCTGSLAEDIVFEELVTLYRPYLVCWASYLGLEKPEHQHEQPVTAWEPAGVPCARLWGQSEFEIYMPFPALKHAQIYLWKKRKS